eukprot:jgi/Chlat1/2089/Chrsp17S02692
MAAAVGGRACARALRCSLSSLNSLPLPSASVLSAASTSGRRSFAAEASCSEEKSARERRISRLLYRSRQRGLLELDLVMGRWAADHASGMSASALDAYEELLGEENPDLWRMLTGQAEPDPRLVNNEAFAALRDHVGSHLRAHATTSARAPPGREWVRGWDDYKNNDDRAAGTPPAGNQ